MQKLFENFKLEIKKEKITNERQSIIKEFVDEINKERPCTYKDQNGKIKKLGLVDVRGVAIRLSVLKGEQTLREFLSECKDYRNRHGSFSKRFFTKSSFK